MVRKEGFQGATFNSGMRALWSSPEVRDGCSVSQQQVYSEGFLSREATDNFQGRGGFPGYRMVRPVSRGWSSTSGGEDMTEVGSGNQASRAGTSQQSFRIIQCTEVSFLIQCEYSAVYVTWGILRTFR